MKRKVTRRKQVPTRTLGNLNVRKKVAVKPHTRKNRNGKRVMVKAYERKVGGSKDSISESIKTKPNSGAEFERIKSEITSYGDKEKKNLNTFQANGSDILTQYRTKLYQQVKDKFKRKSKQPKPKDPIGKKWNKFDVAMQDFMGKHGSVYKKYF